MGSWILQRNGWMIRIKFLLLYIYVYDSSGFDDNIVFIYCIHVLKIAGDLWYLSPLILYQLWQVLPGIILLFQKCFIVTFSILVTIWPSGCIISFTLAAHNCLFHILIKGIPSANKPSLVMSSLKTNESMDFVFRVGGQTLQCKGTWK